MPQFAPGIAKIAIAPIVAKPSGMNCEAELFLGPDELTKVVSSGRIPFVSTGAAKNVSLPITMPSSPGTYHGYIDVYAESLRFLAYILKENVVIAAPVKVTLRPNAPGDVTQLITSDGVNWAMVDEVVPDEGATSVRASPDVTQYDLYNLPASSGSGMINSIKVYIRAYLGNDAAAKARIKIKTGGTEYDNGSDIPLSANYVTYSYQWCTNPKTGVAWTWNDIDALQIGVCLSTTGRCTQVYVEVIPEGYIEGSAFYMPSKMTVKVTDGTILDMYWNCEFEVAITNKGAAAGSYTLLITGSTDDQPTHRQWTENITLGSGQIYTWKASQWVDFRQLSYYKFVLQGSWEKDNYCEGIARL